MPRKRKVVAAHGIRFLFTYDEDEPELLHIWVRHLTTVDDALDLFFNATRTDWNQQFERFESFSESLGLYWFWLKENETVVVISCFRRDML